MCTCFPLVASAIGGDFSVNWKKDEIYLFLSSASSHFARVRRRAKEGRKKKRLWEGGVAASCAAEQGTPHLSLDSAICDQSARSRTKEEKSQWAGLDRGTCSDSAPPLHLSRFQKKKKFLSLPLSPLLLLLRVRHKRPSERFSFSWAPGARWLRRAPSLTLLILFSVDKKLFQIKIKFCTSLSFSLLETPSKIKKKTRKSKYFNCDWDLSFEKNSDKCSLM